MADFASQNATRIGRCPPLPRTPIPPCDHLDQRVASWVKRGRLPHWHVINVAPIDLTMTQLLDWLPRITNRLKHRKKREHLFLLDTDRFELSAAAERMRIDRNGSILSLLIIRPAKTQSSQEAIERFEQVMAQRLRLTDTAGWMRDGRLGILLPDTDEHGAWKVATDLCETFPVGSDRPDCEVVVYPDKPVPGRKQEAGTNGQVTVRPSAARRSSSNGSALESTALPPSPFDDLWIHETPLWKRALDITGASVGLLVATPVIAVAAAAIRLSSPGPVFFTQVREGRAGRRFKIYKLRTMRPDAESLKAGLRASSEQDGPAFKMADDPRITPIGHFLRKLSIDELPQLLNVLTGEMSLVGPRPLPVDESQACKPWQRRRLHVTPGLTCIWQIHGRNVVLFDDWIRMDLEYAERRSPWLDLKLVLLTAPSLLLRKGR